MSQSEADTRAYGGVPRGLLLGGRRAGRRSRSSPPGSRG